MREDVYVLGQNGIKATPKECYQLCDIFDKGFSYQRPASFDGERVEKIPVYHVRYDSYSDPSANRWRIVAAAGSR